MLIIHSQKQFKIKLKLFRFRFDVQTSPKMFMQHEFDLFDEYRAFDSKLELDSSTMLEKRLEKRSCFHLS